MLSTGVLPRGTAAEAHARDQASIPAVHSGQQEEAMAGSLPWVQAEPQPHSPRRACHPSPGPAP